MAEEVKKIYRLSTGRTVRVSADKEAAFLEKHPNAEFIMVEAKDDPLSVESAITTPTIIQEGPSVSLSMGKDQSPVSSVQGENVGLGLSLGDSSSDSPEYKTTSNGIKSQSTFPEWLTVGWFPELKKDSVEYVVEPQPWEDPVETLVEEAEDPLDEFSENFQEVVEESQDSKEPPVYITNESVASIDAIQSNELLPDWLKEAGVYSLISKHRNNVGWQDSQINSEEEFWDALKPYTTTTYKPGNPKASKFQTQGTTTTHYWIGNVEKAQDPELYAELYTLYETKLLVEDIRKRDVFGTYV